MKRLAVLLVLLLAGCATPPAPPVSHAELLDIVTSMRDIAWTDANYVNDDRPRLGSAPTLSDVAWSTDAERCFSESGYRVQQVDFEFIYQSGQNQDYREFALTDYRCTNAHPRLGALAAVIDSSAHAALVNYVDGVVRPCLALAGHPVESSQASGEYGSYTNLDPFPSLELPPKERALLLEKCPPVPGWLTLQ